MSAKDPLIAIMHIRDACERIISYTAAETLWIESPLVLDAVCRNITVIGEAARRLDEEFRSSHPEIPWSGLIGARNIIMHTYDQVRPDLIREMAEVHVPRLLEHCQRMLNGR